MSLVSSKQLLLDAQSGRYAVCAFNAENMEMVIAILKTAGENKAPVIIQTTSSTLKYASPEMFFGMVKAASVQYDTPVALHLDHGSSYELAMHCARAGYTSVMIDGSQLPFEKNISLVQKVVEDCKMLHIPVEAELGRVGGKEDNIVCSGLAYTDPDDAVEFAQRTDIDSLAVAIGTAHGVYKGTPQLDIERLKEIKGRVSVPLVLHGTSGVPTDKVQACIENGICKVNYATDLRIAYSDGIKKYLSENPETFDPKKYGEAGMENVCACVRDRIFLCGSQNRA